MLCGTSNWPGPRAFAAPPLHELAVCGEARDAGVWALAIGDQDVAVLLDRDIGHAVEGVLRLVTAGDALLAQRHKKLALRGELECLHITPIGDPDIARTVDAEKMRGLEHVLAPAAQEFAVAIKDHDRHRLIAVEHVNV